MVPQLGAPIGFIAANGLFLLLGLWLSPDDFRNWGWRLPFLLSAVLVGLGLWVRLRLAETPAFAAALAEAPPPKLPLAEVFRRHLPATLAGTFGVVACFALYYLVTAFALGYGTTRLGYSKTAFLTVQIVAILFMAAGILAAGWLSDRWNPRRVLILGCAATLLAGLAMAPLMEAGSLLLVFLFLAFALTCMGFVYGPLGAWLPGLFPPLARYTGASIAFNVGGILGGALTPFVAELLARRGGLWPVGLYLSTAAVVSLVALLALRRQPDFHDDAQLVIPGP
jgi:MFS family permease